MEDPVSVVVTGLGSWTSSNTDNIKPEIGPVFNYKRVDTRYNDYVLVYATTHNENPASIGYSQIDYKDVVSIDIRTSYGNTLTAGRAHLIKLRDEARRLMYASKTTLGGYRQVKILNVQDLSDKSIGLWRMVVDVELWKVLDTTPS